MDMHVGPRLPHNTCQSGSLVIQLCGANISMSGITTVNALGANIELSPYWYSGYHDVLPGRMQELRGANRIDNVKALATWWCKIASY